MKHIILKLKRYIKNIIYYIPIILKDTDYDYENIYGLLYYKLKKMEKFHLSDNAICANNIKTAKQIKIAKNVCKRLYENNYILNASIEYDKKYNDEDLFKFKKTKNNLYKLIIDKESQQSKDFDKCSNLSDYLKNQDKEYLFKYLNKYIENWWD